MAGFLRDGVLAMAFAYEPEVRLAGVILAQVGILAGARRFVGRMGAAAGGVKTAQDGWMGVWCDVLLIDLLVMYLAVGVPGILGVLNTASVLGMSFLMAGGLWLAGRGEQAGVEFPGRGQAVVVRCVVGFFAGYVAWFVLSRLPAPILTNDAMTYHFPAAVKWVQEGRISIFETWYFNPANSYSPLAGSVWITWWLAPIGNDALAKFVQIPALIFLMMGCARLIGVLGGKAGMAAVVALAAVICQPVYRQAVTTEKDDVYVAGLVIYLVGAVCRERMQDRLGAVRIGVGLGLLLATKYTALMLIPALLLLVDAPVRARWGWRKYATAFGGVILLAGPWYLRNWVVTGNPVFPVKVMGFAGLFETRVSSELTSWAGVWRTLTAHDQSLQSYLLVVGLVGLAGYWAMNWRRGISEPATRMVMVGPLVIVGVFVMSAPYAEVRFVMGAFALLFVAVGCVLGRLGWAGWAMGVGLAVVCLRTGMGNFFRVESLVWGAFGLVACAAWYELRGMLGKHAGVFGRATAVGAALLTAALIYTQWPGTLIANQGGAALVYSARYGDKVGIWRFIRDELEPGTLAYANTFFVLPMQGYWIDRKVVYVSTSAGERLMDLPGFAGKVNGETMLGAVAQAMRAKTVEAEVWYGRLKKAGVKFLVVYARDAGEHPVEFGLIEQLGGRFEVVYSDPGGTVYRVK